MQNNGCAAPVFEALDVSFGYGEKPLFEHFSLTLNAGERVALVGPSGRGKSTLAAVLAGYRAAHTGTILLDGKPVSAKGASPVQLIYQHPEQAVNPRWKMRATLCEGLLQNNNVMTNKTGDGGISDAFLAQCGIERAWLDRYPAELSGGEIQRFCIARALGPSTRVLIADEITTMLDVISQAQIWEMLLAAVRARSLALLVITHNPNLARLVCSRVVEM